jgi:hypothetical protein
MFVDSRCDTVERVHLCNNHSEFSNTLIPNQPVEASYIRKAEAEMEECTTCIRPHCERLP